MNALETVKTHLKPGQVYRRSDLENGREVLIAMLLDW